MEDAVSTEDIEEASERTCAYEKHTGQVNRHVHAGKPPLVPAPLA